MRIGSERHRLGTGSSGLNRKKDWTNFHLDKNLGNDFVSTLRRFGDRYDELEHNSLAKSYHKSVIFLMGEDENV